MADHIHLKLVAPDVVSATDLLRDLKSYWSRRLNISCGEVKKWWAERGSVRRLLGEAAIDAAIEYVLTQMNPLVLWHPAG